MPCPLGIFFFQKFIKCPGKKSDCPMGGLDGWAVGKKLIPRLWFFSEQLLLKTLFLFEEPLCDKSTRHNNKKGENRGPLTSLPVNRLQGRRSCQLLITLFCQCLVCLCVVCFCWFLSYTCLAERSVSRAV